MRIISFHNMSNYHFDFQKFSIIQERSAMKVGTDGVLLGAWASLPDVSLLGDTAPRILDIGTGTGLIALMLAQRFPNALIDAIEIDHDSAEEAKMNVGNSPWKDRITVIETALCDYCNPPYRYSLIGSNPPFYNATLKPEDESRAIARHYDALPFSDISAYADKNLEDNGLLAVIYPTNCEDNILTGIATSSLRYNKICNIITKEGKPCKRRMIECCRKNNFSTSSPTSIVENQILCLRNKDNNFTHEYINLTKPFYL